MYSQEIDRVHCKSRWISHCIQPPIIHYQTHRKQMDGIDESRQWERVQLQQMQSDLDEQKWQAVQTSCPWLLESKRYLIRVRVCCPKKISKATRALLFHLIQRRLIMYIVQTPSSVNKKLEMSLCESCTLTSLVKGEGCVACAKLAMIYWERRVTALYSARASGSQRLLWAKIWLATGRLFWGKSLEK